MKKILQTSIILFSIFTMSSCALFKDAPTQYAMDPVCNMKVDTSEGYSYKYKGKTYYFDNVSCRESFKMDPEKFLQNKCNK